MSNNKEISYNHRQVTDMLRSCMDNEREYTVDFLERMFDNGYINRSEY